jgi:hypothetical protein
MRSLRSLLNWADFWVGANAKGGETHLILTDSWLSSLQQIVAISGTDGLIARGSSFKSNPSDPDRQLIVE